MGSWASALLGLEACRVRPSLPPVVGTRAADPADPSEEPDAGAHHPEQEYEKHQEADGVGQDPEDRVHGCIPSDQSRWRQAAGGGWQGTQVGWRAPCRWSGLGLLEVPVVLIESDRHP